MVCIKIKEKKMNLEELFKKWVNHPKEGSGRSNLKKPIYLGKRSYKIFAIGETAIIQKRMSLQKIYCIQEK